MGKFEDLTGKVYGRLTVIKRVENDKHGNVRWLCRCTCGKEIIVVTRDLKNKHTTSCGCDKIEKLIERSTTHGMSNTSIYNCWNQMIGRCENPNRPDFDRYDGRGIKVCERWHKFENFYEDVSQMEHFGEKGYTLDRENNDGDYCPENCRWADAATQRRNNRKIIKVNYNGVEMCLKDAAEKSGINYQTLQGRYKRSDDLFAPVEDERIIIKYEGEEMCLAEAAEKSGINYDTLLGRYKRGDRGEKLFRPARKKISRKS